jgi:membrane complex biogenesis BtpA family protein
MDALERIIGVRKPLIAAATLLGLPGRPRYDDQGGIDKVVDAAARDIEQLQRGGVDALLFVNEHDLPYPAEAGIEAVAAMSAIIGRLRAMTSVPFGIDLLWDAKATLAVAHATSARFVRGVFTGVFESDMGLLARDWGSLAGYRHQIGADAIAVFTNVTPEYAWPVSQRPLADRVRSAAALGVDGLLVSGGYIGVSPSSDNLKTVKQVAPDLPVMAISGVVEESIARILAVADGVIVGSALRQGGSVFNPVDPDRVRRMVRLAAEARAAQAGMAA